MVDATVHRALGIVLVTAGRCRMGLLPGFLQQPGLCPPRCLPLFPGVVVGGWQAEPTLKRQRQLIPELRHDGSCRDAPAALRTERL